MTGAGSDRTTAGLRSPRLALSLGAASVAFAAADTYVVVLALPEMMAGAGLASDELQRAAPIVSGFLLGYVGMLPLVGRIADVRGRVPVLVGSLLVFAAGSLVTAAAYDLGSMVAGRFLQGVGGGGLVPATLALVADLWPVHRRGVPLGVVGAVQELGSVLGPLLGAVVLALGTWRDIFWLNLAGGLLLAAGIARLGRHRTPRRPDVTGGVLVVLVAGCLALVMLRPERLVSDVTYGLAFLPVVGSSRWLTPLALLGAGLLALLVARLATAAQPLVDWRHWPATLRRTDPAGAVLLGLALGGVVLAFATADPQVQVLSPAGPWLLMAAGVAAAGFVLRQRRADNPLVPVDAVRARAAWGGLAVSFLVGSSLIAALVDIPFFARITVYPDSQLDAALVLVRFLVALPVGAVLGGWAVRTVSTGLLTGGGMLLSAAGFAWMATWDASALEAATATMPLVLAGLGFGLAIAPVNAAVLAATPTGVHGIASALVVVARMVGMLVGLSALTSIGLRTFYDRAAAVPPVQQLCPESPQSCPAYGEALRQAGIAQLHVIFAGAAVAAVLAAVAALVLLRGSIGRKSPAPVEVLS